MAGRTEDTLLTLGKKRTQLNLTFFPAGTGVPTFNVFDMRGASVLWTSTGLWTVTLEDNWRRLVSKSFGLQMAAATDLNLQFGAISNFGTSTLPTIVIRALAGATPTDIAANAANSISLQLVVCDSDAF